MDKMNKIFSYKRENQEIGGTCHNDKPGLQEGGGKGKSKKGGRKEKREGEKAGPATMTSRAYKIKKGGRRGEGREGSRRDLPQ